MPNTLVIQSHRSPLPYTWIETCLESVREWCALNQYDHQFMGDELFAGVSAPIMEKTKNQKVVATDLARLLVLKVALQNYETVIWLDADFLIFNPEEFILPDDLFAVGREVWVQLDKNDKLKSYKKVHNAFLMFRRGNTFLDFYTETAERLLNENNGTMPPQFIGPKLLTALHNIISLPVMETAGMFSPMVVKDLLRGGGRALELFKKDSPVFIAGADLCISSCENNEISELEMMQLISSLLKSQ